MHDNSTQGCGVIQLHNAKLSTTQSIASKFITQAGHKLDPPMYMYISETFNGATKRIYTCTIAAAFAVVENAQLYMHLLRVPTNSNKKTQRSGG